jgi:DNA-binding transcriptional LysR family regulator
MASPHTEIDALADMSLPDWDDFRVLLAVVQLGSITRAAATLGLTQPTVSRRLERLEKRMKLRLLDRVHSGAVLTPDGQRIVEELNVAHASIQRALESANPQSARMSDVKLLTTDGLATYWLPRFLPYLLDRHRDIEFRIYTTSDSGAEQRGHFDLSIHYIQPTDPNLITVRLGTLHFVPYASPAYLARHGEPQSAEDLSRHRLLDYILYLIDKGTWMTRLPAVLGEGRAQLFTNSSGALCENVRNGAGIALLPTYVSVFERNLVPIEVGMRFETPFWLCYPQEAMAQRSTRIAIAFLRHIFGRRTMPWFGEQYLSPSSFPAITPEDVMAKLSTRDEALPVQPALVRV